MVDELREYNEALRGLRTAVRDLRAQALDTNQVMNDLINKSHLRSTLTLLREDIGLRKTLELL